MQQIELFELSDNNNPLTCEGEVVRRVDDVLDRINDPALYELVRTTIACIVDTMQAEIDDLQAEIDETKRDKQDAEDAEVDVRCELQEQKEKSEKGYCLLEELQAELEYAARTEGQPLTWQETQGRLQEIMEVLE